MAKLQGDSAAEFEEMRVRAVQEIKNGNHDEVRDMLSSAWDNLPDGKYEYSESYIIVWYILSNSIECNDIGTMNQWVDKIFHAAPSRGDTGEREMWAGRVAYESGEKEKALGYFRVAHKKSKGRAFWKDDTKYKAFLMENGLT